MVDSVQASVQQSTIDLLTFSSLKDFEAVTKDLEKQLGYLDQDKALADPDHIANSTKKMEGTSGLMIISLLEMDKLLPQLSVSGAKAHQYLIGNPNIADKMTANDILVALMVPPRVLVYTDEGKTKISYERPSSQLSRLGSEPINAVAKMLDKKFEDLIKTALT